MSPKGLTPVDNARNAGTSVALGRNAHGRGAVEACAVSVQRRPVHRGVASAAGPRRVAAAIPEARLMTDMHLTGAELVAVWASRRRASDPRPGGGLY